MPSAASSGRTDRPRQVDAAPTPVPGGGSQAGAPRFHCPMALVPGADVELPDGAARHAQVLRLQPGDAVVLFGGASPCDGGEFGATVLAMGRQSVRVRVGNYLPRERESTRTLHLAIGMPANERMDWLVEKATELGVATIQPLMTERTVVRLDGPRAARRHAHWQGIAVGACEQCGRNRVPLIHPPLPMARWPGLQPEPGGRAPAGPGAEARLVLSLQADGVALRQWVCGPGREAGVVTLLCGPEGGLSGAEESAAMVVGYRAVSLGPRILRAETAALAALTLLA